MLRPLERIACVVGVGAIVCAGFLGWVLPELASTEQALVADTSPVATVGPQQMAVREMAVRGEGRSEADTATEARWRNPDQSDWSRSRVEKFFAALRAVSPQGPSAVLRIPAIGLEAGVFEGTGEWTLNIGVGRIEGTAAFDTPGNIGLAGHRDGVFRGLRHVEIGDRIELETTRGATQFQVVELLIVDPEDIYVLDPTDEATVTLVTCYPFHFLGNAPQRFIVRGVATGMFNVKEI